MTPQEMDWLLSRHRRSIDFDIRAIEAIVDRAQYEAVSKLHNHMRKAEGVDPEMIDQIAAEARIGEEK
jgi:hypothetical protein